MALQPTRWEFRVELSHVDRKIELREVVIASRHPSETAEHLMLRVLAWCLLWEERLAFGPGLSASDAADLWAHDLTGRLTTWIECGAARAEEVRRIVQQHAGARVACVFDDEKRLAELQRGMAEWKRAGEVALWLVDRALVTALARHESRRQKWTVTIVGDHAYVDADGESHDGAITSIAAS